MKCRKTICVLLLICMVLPVLTSCKLLSGETEQNNPLHETETVLSHVYRMENITLPEGLIPAPNVQPYYENGMIHMYCKKTVPTEDGNRIEHYLCKVPLDGGDPVLLSMDLENLYANLGVIKGESVYLISSVRDNKTMSTIHNLTVYGAKENTKAVKEDIVSVFTSLQSSEPRLQGIAVDKDGYIYISSEDVVCVLAPDFEKVHEILCDDYIEGLSVDNQGNVQVLGHLTAQTIDRESGQCTNLTTLPETVGEATIFFGEGYDLFYSTAEGLFGMNHGDKQQGEMLVDWENSHVKSAHIESMCILSPEKIYISTDGEYGILQKADDVDLTNVTTIDIAYVTADDHLVEKIVEFHKTNGAVHVNTKDYSVYNTDENENGGVTMLVQDILNDIYVPDLVCGLGDSVVITTLLEQGKFTDLYTFIETDAEIQKEDLVGAVVNTYEIDGKLSAAVPDFQIKTLLAPKSVVGDRTSWTTEEMLDIALSSAEQGVSLMNRQTADEWLKSGMAYTSFIDMKNFTCSFDSDTFRKLLQYISILPEVEEETENMFEPYQTGRMVLFPRRYYGVNDYQGDPVIYDGEEFVRIGYPDEGHILWNVTGKSMAYLIPDKAVHKDEAWSFLRTLILDVPDVKIESPNGLRMLRSTNEKHKSAFSMYTYFYKYNGQVSLWYGYREDKMPDENGLVNGEPGVLVTYDETKYDTFLDWMDEAGSSIVGKMPLELKNIIDEEVNAFRSGMKDAEETATVIQSRVSLWLAEKK